MGSPCGFCPALNLGLRAISLISGRSDDYRTHYSQTSKVTTTQRLRHTCDKICPSYQLVISIGNVLGRHLWNPLAAAIYGLNLMTVNALGTLLWFYASSRPGLISDGVSPRAIRFIARLHSARIAVYAAAVLLAPWLTIGSVALFAAATVFFGLPNPFLERRLAELGLT